MRTTVIMIILSVFHSLPKVFKDKLFLSISLEFLSCGSIYNSVIRHHVSKMENLSRMREDPFLYSCSVLVLLK